MNVCIIIPMYNEAMRFDGKTLLNFSSEYTIDFLLVDDGSTDNTPKIIEELSEKDTRISCLSLEKNSGKAEAIRLGVHKALTHKDYDFIGYLDADFATPVFEINRLINTALTYKKSFVMGSRVKRLGANIKRYKSRHIAGRIIATFISEFILKLPVYDTQCGAKLISTSHAHVLFKDPFVTKWFFDVELIARLQKEYDSNYCINAIYEMPLMQWEDKGASKITLLDMLKVPFKLLKVYAHYR